MSTLNADASIKCSYSDPSYALMSRLGLLSITVYGAGLPLAFGVLLWKHSAAITADQSLRAKGEGETGLTNPNITIRRRFRKLYEDYKPEYRYWKLVLIARKLCLATIGILLPSNPTLQASVSCRWHAFVRRHCGEKLRTVSVLMRLCFGCVCPGAFRRVCPYRYCSCHTSFTSDVGRSCVFGT